MAVYLYRSTRHLLTLLHTPLHIDLFPPLPTCLLGNVRRFFSDGVTLTRSRKHRGRCTGGGGRRCACRGTPGVVLCEPCSDSSRGRCSAFEALENRRGATGVSWVIPYWKSLKEVNGPFWVVTSKEKMISEGVISRAAGFFLFCFGYRYSDQGNGESERVMSVQCGRVRYVPLQCDRRE